MLDFKLTQDMFIIFQAIIGLCLLLKKNAKERKKKIPLLSYEKIKENQI